MVKANESVVYLIGLFQRYDVYIIFCFLILIIVKSIPWIYKIFQQRKMARSGIKDIDRMNGFQFEEYLKVLFKKLGYRPVVTKKSGDYGADIVLKGKNKVVIQAKRYGYKHRVSLDAIREVYAAKAYYKADEAWVITNSFYTKQAKILGSACGVKLLDRFDLQDFICEIKPEKHASDFLKERDD
ncbi:restriction endonuclease [Virgibacillus sp.]|uniref:restriction endonuclease n=1 Tax=Virgibacillus sp. TaxID=1872700 RepID=UPI0017E66D4F|nr:restriction endonuclease [Virgibacillus sp.]NWO12694.1 restriction endonuclease [Virgibacillus sp.]